MSRFEQGDGGPITDADQIHNNPGIEQEKIINEPTLRTSADQPSEDINQGKKIKREGPYIQPAEPPRRLSQSQSAEIATPGDEEALDSDRAPIERLGRERPAKFKSSGAELAFCYSVIASQFMSEYFVSGFNVILPTLIKDLSIPQASAVWPASAFALVSAAFFLPFGRLADMYGGYPVYLFGLVWFTIWTIIAGFAQTDLMLDFCRALQGLGPAAFLPSGVMLIGSTYRPGPRKNLVFSIYGGAAPLGFFAGVFIAGVTGSFLQFGWYFWIGAMLVSTTIVAAIFAIPNDIEERKAMGVQMDWLGSIFIVSGLILVIFAITDASHAPDGWRTQYIYVTLTVGALLIGISFYIEGWVAANPLLPFDLFQVPYLSALFVALFFSDGVLGIFLLYATLYMQDIMGASPLQVAAWYVPMCAGGCMISIVGGYILHLLPGTVLMLIGGGAWVGNSLLFALAPEGANYWAFIFPAMICATMGIDIIYNVANIFITTSLSQSRQGLAGALINSLLYLGIAFLLAFADVIQTGTRDVGLKRSYQSVFWYQFACSVLALVIMIGFVRIRKAESEMTTDERAALEVHRSRSR
ncbi:hypothetical protein HO133_005672 [Letharia lupina]|uniref:Major facilitator superfamily (MFS) profile domain-containing protein n=1 Tax=Letharia lupina TaxID=560253 RepID=A0A8H6C7C6_9LECA|nr:uncharacterized protein HO133_005672 [Letharia lupina]KAF6218325.1 hypothetical protein HO133_005672 [Letharia lupina]